MDLRSFFKPENWLRESVTTRGREASAKHVRMAEGPVVTRIAPSPTGHFHIGTARSALFNYLFAKQHKGRFIVRIEDTDKERSKKEYEDDILDGLSWLGLEYDELHRQSERVDAHIRHLETLIGNGSAFVSKEAGKESPGAEVSVVRLKNPNMRIVFNDLIRGEVAFDTTELGDFVIARSTTDPLYHFAVVADDHDMGVTHVIRGEDHISNTPRQILIQEALGFPRPYYVHLPLILNPDRSKMSKRGKGATIREYREEGYYPEALLNYLALLGWNPGTDRERFTLDELVEAFDITKVQKGAAIFNIEKLQWFNRQFLQTISPWKIKKGVLEHLPARFLKDHETERIVERMVPLLKEKIRTVADITHMIKNGDLDYFFIRPVVLTEKLSWKGETLSETIRAHLQAVIVLVEHIPAGDFTAAAVKRAVWDYATERGRGEVLWPMRYALSGEEKSPDPFTIAEIIGKKETLERLQAVL